MDRKAACRRGAHCVPDWMSHASRAAGTARLHDLSRRVREGELPRNLVGGDDSPNVALEQWERCGYTIHPVGREKVNCRALRGGITFAYPDMEMGGSWKASLTLARAARPEGRGGDSQEAGGTLVPPPLVCLRRIAASFPRARNARPYGVDAAFNAPSHDPGQFGAPRSWPRPASLAAARQFTFSAPTKSRGNSPSRTLWKPSARWGK